MSTQLRIRNIGPPTAVKVTTAVVLGLIVGVASQAAYVTVQLVASDATSGLP